MKHLNQKSVSVLCSSVLKNKIRQNQAICCKCAFSVYLLFYKKGGKNQAGLNCEYNSLSELVLILSHSNERFSNVRSSNKMWSIRTF